MSKIDDVLPLPETAKVTLICPDILLLRGVVPEWRNELIQLAETSQRFKQSSQVNANGGKHYADANRSSYSMMLTSQDPAYGPAIHRFEEALIRVYHSGILAYKRYNSFLSITDDSGYELLRYREGEAFGMHTDAVLGRNEGFRQVSGMIYLNDDYQGGETYFPRQGIKFKAQAGDLLLFPSNFCYPHEALPVTKGTKYAIVTWFVAYPKKTASSSEEDGHGEQSKGDADGTPTPADGGVRLHGSTGSGSDEREPEASDREHSTSVG